MVKYTTDYFFWNIRFQNLLGWVVATGGPGSPYFDALIECIHEMPSYEKEGQMYSWIRKWLVRLGLIERRKLSGEWSLDETVDLEFEYGLDVVDKISKEIEKDKL